MPIGYVFMGNFYSDGVSVSVCLSFPSCILDLNAFDHVQTRLSSTACMQLLNSFTGSFSQTTHTAFCKSSPISCLALNGTFFSLLVVQARSQKMCHSHLFASPKDVCTFSLQCCALKHCRLEKSLIIGEIGIGGLVLL